MNFVHDTVLKKAIDVIYSQYDRDRSGSLDKAELTQCFSMLLSMVGNPTFVDNFLVGQLLQRLDKDHNGSISKQQFLQMFRLLEASAGTIGKPGMQNNGMTNQPPPQNWGNNQPQQQQQNWGNNQPQQNWGNNQPQQNYGNMGYGNQDYNNQGYGNQGYGNQGNNGGW